MRSIKELLELLLEEFKNNWAGKGLCLNVFRMMEKRKITPDEHRYLHNHIRKDQYYRFGKHSYAFGELIGLKQKELFKKNHTLRIEWLEKMIKILN